MKKRNNFIPKGYMFHKAYNLQRKYEKMMKNFHVGIGGNKKNKLNYTKKQSSFKYNKIRF